jgi:phosphoesterase RecJ-like protein
MTTRPDGQVKDIVDAIASRQRFVISSHARPDGDSIGSQMAMAYALKALGKEVSVVNSDAAPSALLTFPGVDGIEIARRVDGAFDAAVVMECSDLSRTGVQGLDRYFLINIDHHPGNTGYGQINWFDASRAACAEMVYDLVVALGVERTAEIATHVYLAILTDTGSFHYSGISPRTFDICREALLAGVDPVFVARSVYDSNSMGRLRLFGAVLNGMWVDGTGRVAVISLDERTMKTSGGTYEDTDGLVNMPLTVKAIQAVVFFKQSEGDADEYRVSLRSKGDVDVGSVARAFGGGGHKNAAGCTVRGDLEALRRTFAEKTLGELS